MILDVCVPSVISLAGGLEGGSQNGPEGGSSYETKLFCNSLKLTEEDTTASDEMKKDAAKHFRDINCTLDDACAICHLKEKPPVQFIGPGLDGGGGEEYRPVPCNSPFACPVITTTTELPVSTNSGGNINDNSNSNSNVNGNGNGDSNGNKHDNGNSNVRPGDEQRGRNGQGIGGSSPPPASLGGRRGGGDRQVEGPSRLGDGLGGESGQGGGGGGGEGSEQVSSYSSQNKRNANREEEVGK